ncbi:ATP-grasp domain protein [Nocardioides panacihumi]|uniref:ATP-grasp domain protein n=1 Tax=Nocardioides panacihumi TaxID=400774 RepID=A0ABN2Q609_9ACTN
MPRILLATYQLMPDGEPGGGALLTALTARGIDAAWARWDDPAADWAGADLVAVRSTWDYYRRAPEFLAWVRGLPRLLNGADVIAWNADKAYLCELPAAGIPTVPTELLDDATLVDGLATAVERWGTVVVKPRTGAGGVGVCVVSSAADDRLEGLVAAPWVVQPLVESVRTTGETSVFVFAGAPAAQVQKVPGGGDIRVNELYGGSSRPVPLTREHAALAEAAVRAAADRHGHPIDYARVDMLTYDDRLVVSELELIEPGLYLDVEPGNADGFADMVAARLAGGV